LIITTHAKNPTFVNVDFRRRAQQDTKVANKLRNQELKGNLEAIRPIVGNAEEAMEYDLLDALEIIL